MFSKIPHLLLLLLFLIVSLSASADREFDEIIIFGDSLSDNGNLAALPEFEFLLEPPFAGGFSNGDLAVKVLADGLELEAKPSLFLVLLPNELQGTNFAVAGARSVTIPGSFPIDLPVQVGVFLASRDDSAPPQALYVVIIGGDDVRDARDTAGSEMAKDIITHAVDEIESAIRTLSWAGATYFVVANVPDIGVIPESRLIGGITAQRASKLTRMFNGLLAEAVEDIEEDIDIEILEFNTFRFIRSVIANAEHLGFENTQDPCLFTLGCDFNSFIFFDEIHPTAKVHALAGKALLELVRDNHDKDDDDYDDVD